MTTNNKFNEGVSSVYAELPVAVNYLYWKRGNGQLAHLKETDPGAYFGGWAASVASREGDPYPELPIPIVTRISDDGKAQYQRYATNILSIIPIVSRQRYELRKKSMNAEGREEEKVVAISKNYESGVHVGYQPHKQIFCIVVNDNNQMGYAVVKLNKWSSYLSFSRAAQAWSKVKSTETEVLIRRYGTIGATNKQGQIFPNFETFNEGKSTPIEAIGVLSPRFMPITPELDKLWDDAQDWAKCEKWNASGKLAEEVQDLLPPMPEPSEEFPFG